MNSDTVIVGCKLPHGLVLELGYTLGANGGQVTYGKDYKKIRVNGTNHGYQDRTKGHTAGEIALTPGVPKDFWDEWFKKNKDLAFVREGLIFAQPNAASADAVKREREDLKTKLEPLDPRDTTMVPGVTRDKDAA